MSTFGTMYLDSVRFPGNYKWCKWYYKDLPKAGVTAETKLLTTIIILCTIWLEILVHANIGGLRSMSEEYNEDAENSSSHFIIDEQPPRQSTSSASSNSTFSETSRWSSETLHAVTHLEAPKSQWESGPPAQASVRVARLLLGFFFYLAVLAAFVLRIMDIRDSMHLWYGCEQYIPVPGPNIAALVFLNIVPFLCATSAFLRAVADCYLIRKGKGLHYDLKSGWSDRNGYVWLPCMPLVGVPIVLGMFMQLVCESVKFSIALVKGEASIPRFAWRRRSTMPVTRMSMESGEENVGLLDRGNESEDFTIYDSDDADDEGKVAELKNKSS